jgi:spore maturation protein CgeB
MAGRRDTRSRRSRRILFVGEQWGGSNAASVERALRRAGHVVAVVDPLVLRLDNDPPFHLRVARRLLRKWVLEEVGRQVLIAAKSFAADLMVVYKGNLLPRWALESVKARGVYCLNVWPDVSVTVHGSEIPECLPLYDRILTTKSFGPGDLRALGIATPTEFVPDVYDPDMERMVAPQERDLAVMGCDVGFIGTWSPKKTRFLRAVAERAPDVRLRVWGTQWAGQSRSLDDLAGAVQGYSVIGDLYALAIACTTINVGLLSERRPGASSGDLTTSRTFEIPACGGFMLHERTDEVLSFFTEGTEIACFGDEVELVEKIRYYLAHDQEREKMRRAAHERCIAEYSVDGLAEGIIRRYEEDTGR